MYALFQSLLTSNKPSTQELSNVLSDKGNAASTGNEPPRFDRFSWFAKEAKKFADDTITALSTAANKVADTVSSFYNQHKDGPLFPGLLLGTGFALVMVGAGTGCMPVLGVGFGLMALSIMTPSMRAQLYNAVFESK